VASPYTSYIVCSLCAAHSWVTWPMGCCRATARSAAQPRPFGCL